MNLRVAALVTTIIGASLLAGGNMTAYETVFWAVVGGLIVLFIGWILTPFGKPFRQALEAWLYKPDPHNLSKSPLQIEFEGESNVRWLTENNDLFKTQKIQRKIYGITVFNNSDSDVRNVAVEIERIDPISDEKTESIHKSPYLGLKFRFKPDDKPIIDLSPRHRERVPLISHINGMFMGHTIKAESIQGYNFHHNKEKHRLFVKVTGNEVLPVTECFTAWVDAEGNLRMVRG